MADSEFLWTFVGGIIGLVILLVFLDRKWPL